MTEDEARKKWCPMARIHSGTVNYVTAANRGMLSRDEGKDRCIASGCMMWISDSAADGTYKTGSGRCGLAR